MSRARLAVGTETFAGLVVPWCEALPAAALHQLLELAEQGLPLFFVDALPTRSSEGLPAADALRQLAQQANTRVVPLAALADTVTRLGFPEVVCETPQPYLLCYHIQHPGLDVYLFFNEHPFQPINTHVRLKTGGPIGRYDAFANTLAPFACDESDGQARLTLELSPYETALLVAGESIRPLLPALAPANPAAGQELALSGPWTIASATAHQYPNFEAWGTTNVLFDLARPGTLPGFSGTFRYQTSFEGPAAGLAAQLDLGAAFEVVELWVNDQPAGVRLAPPYRFDIGPLRQPGANTLTIDVTNTLVNAQPDFYSRYAVQEPSGLLGPVRLRWSAVG